MATTFINFDDQTQIGRKIARGLQMVRDGRDELRDALAIMQTEINGDGGNATQFDLLKSEASFTDNASAKASWDELNSLYAKLITPSGFSAADVGAAITQACAKHGV